MPVSQGDIEQIFREELARLPVTDIQDTDEFVDDELRGRTSEPAYHCLLADESLIPNGSWPRPSRGVAVISRLDGLLNPEQPRLPATATWTGYETDFGR